MVLQRLEAADGHPELHPLLQVGDRALEGFGDDAQQLGSEAGAGAVEHRSSAPKASPTTPSRLGNTDASSTCVAALRPSTIRWRSMPRRPAWPDHQGTGSARRGGPGATAACDDDQPLSHMPVEHEGLARQPPLAAPSGAAVGPQAVDRGAATRRQPAPAAPPAGQSRQPMLPLLASSPASWISLRAQRHGGQQRRGRQRAPVCSNIAASPLSRRPSRHRASGSAAPASRGRPPRATARRSRPSHRARAAGHAGRHRRATDRNSRALSTGMRCSSSSSGSSSPSLPAGRSTRARQWPDQVELDLRRTAGDRMWSWCRTTGGRCRCSSR